MKKLFSLMSVVALTMAFTACSSIFNSPSSVAKDFLTALKYGDFGKARELATPESHKAIATLETFSALSRFEKVEFTMENEEIDGEYAIVTYTTNKSSEPQNIRLRKDKDKGWLVIFAKADFPNGGGNSDININIDGDLEEASKEVGRAMEDLVNTIFVEFDDEIEVFAKEVERAVEDIGEAAEDLGREIENPPPLIEEKLKELDRKYDKIDLKFDDKELTEEQYDELKDKLDDLKDELKDLQREIKKKNKKGIFD